MWIAIFLYFLVAFACIYLLEKRQEHFLHFPKLKATKMGLTFFSHKRHRIKILNAKIFQLENIVYLNCEDKQVIIKNIDKVMKKNDYLYFTANGRVEINFPFADYRYFVIDIQSTSFDFEKEKQIVFAEILKNIFEFEKQKRFIRFLKILKEVVNINFEKDKLVLKKNDYNLEYVLKYRVGNIVKHLTVGKAKIK